MASSFDSQIPTFGQFVGCKLGDTKGYITCYTSKVSLVETNKSLLFPDTSNSFTCGLVCACLHLLLEYVVVSEAP
jgi:hypothetical protein